jgi:hypothetical protein
MGGQASAVVAALALLTGHLAACLKAFPLHSKDGSLGFVQHDHSFHYYYGWLAQEMLSSGARTWGYDPYFMGGYPKTLIFPTSSTYVELLACLAGSHFGTAYRCYVALSAGLLPMLLGLAAAVLARKAGCFLPALLVSTLWFWTAFPVTYVEWGMTSFIFTTGLTILGAALLLRWLECQQASQGGLSPCVRRLGLWAWAFALLTVAQVGHPSSAVTAGCLFLPWYLARCRRLPLRVHLLLHLGGFLVGVVWAPWWLPAWIARDYCASLATGFVNENVLGRLMELLTARFPTESAIWVGWLGAVVMARGGGDLSRAWGWCGSAGLLVFLGYVAGGLPLLGWLQPGRYTQPLYAWLLVSLVVLLAEAPRAKKMAWTLALGLTCLSVAALMAGWSLMRQAGGLWRPRVNSHLPQELKELAEFLRQLPEQGRVFFEELERRSEFVPHPALDPMKGVNAAALLVPLTRKPFIGGPYLYTHLTTNYAQFGDGKFFGHDAGNLTLEEFQHYADLYNACWLVAWSRPMIRLAHSRRDYFEPVAQFGRIRFYQLRRRPNWAIRGQARVRIQANRLEVYDVETGPDQRVVLSFHWAPGLWGEAELEPYEILSVPVPFIAVRRPPSRFAVTGGSLRAALQWTFKGPFAGDVVAPLCPGGCRGFVAGRARGNPSGALGECGARSWALKPAAVLGPFALVTPPVGPAVADYGLANALGHEVSESRIGGRSR